MSALARLVMCIAIALATAVLAGAPASAQTPADQAARLNDEGKRLFADKNHDGAYRKFREAATLSPEGRYFFNMCYALNFLERFQEAIEACEQVEPAGADPELIEKTRKALASLREKAAAQGGMGGRSGDASSSDHGGAVGADMVGGGDGGGAAGAGMSAGGAGGAGLGSAAGVGAGSGGAAGAEPGGGGAAGAGPPAGPPPPPVGEPDPFVAGQVGPSGSYKWAIGGTLGLLGNLSVGRQVDNVFGNDQEVYGPGGLDLRLFANFILSEAARFGVQASLGIGELEPGQDTFSDDNLVIVDIGAAAFLHLPLAKHIFLTPLFGPQLSVQQPGELSQGFFASGARAELGLSYVFGPQSEHAFSVTPALNVYFPASGTVDGEEAGTYGLDLTHATFGLSAGYTYRFSTPFGTVPLITLE